MSMPAQSSRTGTDSDSSLSLPTVTQATADNRLATGAGGKVGAGGVATLPDTFVAPVTLVCQSNCSAHTQSVMPRYSFVGCCPNALE